MRRLVSNLVATMTAVAMAVALTALPARGLGTPTAVLSGCTLIGTGTTISRTIGTRSYAVHVPTNLTGTSVPLLVDLHGDYEPVVYEERFSGWSAFADTHNFIVAYPVGTGMWASWDWGQGSADVAFLRSVV